MSILVNKNSRIITQGMTGKTGQFHTRLCRDYGFGPECFVGGVNPKTVSYTHLRAHET